MRGSSRASLAAAKQRLIAALHGIAERQALSVGDELFAVVGLLDGDPALRRALSDPARGAHDRIGLAETLLRGKISAATLAQVTGLVGARWSSSRDLADAVEQLAVLAV